MELKDKYIKAWEEVKNNPIGRMWNTMDEAMKEEILIGITNNMRLEDD